MTKKERPQLPDAVQVPSESLRVMFAEYSNVWRMWKGQRGWSVPLSIATVHAGALAAWLSKPDQDPSIGGVLFILVGGFSGLAWFAVAGIDRQLMYLSTVLAAIEKALKSGEAMTPLRMYYEYSTDEFKPTHWVRRWPNLFWSLIKPLEIVLMTWSGLALYIGFRLGGSTAIWHVVQGSIH